MKDIVKTVIILLIVLASNYCLACQFDADCSVGSKCSKPRGSIYGYCVGGLSPGRQNDKKPAYNPMDITGKQGNTCQFDINCGVGGKCLKSSGSIYGTCY